MRSPRRRVGGALLVVVTVAVSLAACSAGPAAPPPNQAPPTGTVRTDPEPITRRFPALGPVADLRWVGGTAGDSRVPGPSTFTIDAVTRLTPTDRDQLAEAAAFTPAADAPAPPPQLVPFVPPGDWDVSDPRAVIGPEGWTTRVYLQRGGTVAYVRSEGQ